MPSQFNLDKLCAYLDSEELEYDRDNVEGVVQFSIQADHGVHDVFFEVNVEGGAFICAVRPPVDFSEDRRPQIYEATALANHDLSMGGFQVNSDEGQILFVLGVPIHDGDLSETQLADVFAVCLEWADLYLPAFEEILEGANAAEAIGRAENRPDPEG